MTQRIQRKNKIEENRRRNRILLMGIILATLPFYCVGGILFFLAPNPQPTPPPTVLVTVTPYGGESVGTIVRASDTPAPLATQTLVPTPTNQTLPTQALGVPATPIPARTATFTPIPTLTHTPFVPPTATAAPSITPIPAATETSIPFESQS
ncbi:MAG: hypothetical protein ACOYLB_08915 [Phototrophicaceae bacterium]